MHGSIYKNTRAKLTNQAVNNPCVAKHILPDKMLVLKFIQLERALMKDHLGSVQLAVRNIEAYLGATGKKNVLRSAYLYVVEPGGAPATYDNRSPIPWGRASNPFLYPKGATKSTMLIIDWAQLWLDRYARSFKHFQARTEQSGNAPGTRQKRHGAGPKLFRTKILH